MTLPLIQVPQIVPVILHKFLSKTLQDLQAQLQILLNKRIVRIQTQLINSLKLTSLQRMLRQYNHHLVQ